MAIGHRQDTLGSSARSEEIERQLDDAGADSFPASDPISLAQPHDPEELGVRSSLMPPSAWLVVGGGLLAVLAVIALRR